MTDREKLIDILTDTFDNQYDQSGFITPHHTADHLLANGVTVQKHGRWEPFHSEVVGDIQFCSACDVGYDRKPDFCPNCGAKMEE